MIMYSSHAPMITKPIWWCMIMYSSHTSIITNPFVTKALCNVVSCGVFPTDSQKAPSTQCFIHKGKGVREKIKSKISIMPHRFDPISIQSNSVHIYFHICTSHNIQVDIIVMFTHGDVILPSTERVRGPLRGLTIVSKLLLWLEELGKGNFDFQEWKVDLHLDSMCRISI